MRCVAMLALFAIAPVVSAAPVTYSVNFVDTVNHPSNGFMYDLSLTGLITVDVDAPIDQSVTDSTLAIDLIGPGVTALAWPKPLDQLPTYTTDANTAFDWHAQNGNLYINNIGGDNDRIVWGSATDPVTNSRQNWVLRSGTDPGGAFVSSWVRAADAPIGELGLVEYVPGVSPANQTQLLIGTRVTRTDIPEPTALLPLAGLAGLCVVRRRR